MLFNAILHNYHNYFEICFIIKKNALINKLKVGKGSDLKKVMKCKTFWIRKANNHLFLLVLPIFLLPSHNYDIPNKIALMQYYIHVIKNEINCRTLRQRKNTF